MRKEDPGDATLQESRIRMSGMHGAGTLKVGLVEYRIDEPVLVVDTYPEEVSNNDIARRIMSAKKEGRKESIQSIANSYAS